MNLICLTYLIVLIGTIQLVQCNQTVNHAPIVQLTNGKVRGLQIEIEDSPKVHVYQGIRYGRAKRFAKPKPVEAWSGVYDATKYQFACPQANIPVAEHPKSHYLAEASSEDCLFLSVWRPAEETANRSVMVYIHGGGFTIGTEFSLTNDGRYLASLGDVVVVSINYRLGVLGLLYGDDAPGNLGLYDQILALKWVQENIAHFGGNPNQVTIFGESAGSMSVGTMVLSPLAKGLFHRAILQSGAPNAFVGAQDKNASLAATNVIATRLKCPTTTVHDSVKCIRSKPTQELSALIKGDLVDTELAVRPIYGDEVLPVKPSEALKSGQFNRDIDLLYGVTNDEAMGVFGTMFPLKLNSTATDLSMEMATGVMKMLFGAFNRNINSSEIVDYYFKNVNKSNPFEIRKALSDALSDYHLVCPTILFAEQIAKHKLHNSYYSYRLMQATSTTMFGCDPSAGVGHAMDVPFVFGLPISLRGIIYTEKEYRLSRDMIHAWTQFAKTGHPGKMSSAEWTAAFEANTGDGVTPMTKFMSLYVDQYKMVSGYYKERCDTFWKPKMF